MSETNGFSPVSRNILQGEDAIQANGGRPQAITVTEMVHLYRPSLLRTAFRILRNAEDAEDAVQNTFISAFTHLESFRGDCLVSTWLTRIVVNQALMQLRRTRRRQVDSLDEVSNANTALKDLLPSRTPSPDNLLLQAEAQQHLLHAMAGLPDGLRVVTHDSLISGQPVAKIAQKHGISEAATKSRLLRARQTLKLKLFAKFRAFPHELFRLGHGSSPESSVYGSASSSQR